MRTIKEPVIKRRGRSAEFDETLLKNLAKIKPGQWVVMDEFGVVNDERQQSQLGAKVRQHFREVHGPDDGLRVSIRWSPDGEIQVGVLPNND